MNVNVFHEQCLWITLNGKTSQFTCGMITEQASVTSKVKKLKPESNFSLTRCLVNLLFQLPLSYNQILQMQNNGSRIWRCKSEKAHPASGSRCQDLCSDRTRICAEIRSVFVLGSNWKQYSNNNTAERIHPFLEIWPPSSERKKKDWCRCQDLSAD